jgi:non-ribosomal peptide synthetase component E (peptide arylation enzyme)
LASFKIPREVRFVSEWPMSATKIQKFKLRERLRTAGA